MRFETRYPVVMDLAQWLTEFRALHQKARRNSLSAEEREVYYAGRNELARAILAAQRMSLQPGLTPRQALRASLALPIEMEIHGRMRPHLTMDISAGGFSAILAEAPAPDEAIRFSLRLPAETEPINGDALCVQSVRQPGRSRCCFRFETVSRADRERVEMLVFDVLLDHLKG